MEKISFILLCSVLFLCSCQENLKDVPGQIILKDEDAAFTQELLSLDALPQNLDSLAIINMNAINVHIAEQEGNYNLRIGINYDGGELLPFTANRDQDCWYGYVSHGVVYRQQSLNWSFALYPASACFIFQNELYVTFRPFTAPPQEEFKIFSLPNLEEMSYHTGFLINNISCRQPYMYNGERYITGGASIIFGTLSFDTYNIDDRQTFTHTLQFPSEFNNSTTCLDVVFVKNNYLYCVVFNSRSYWTNLYKIPIDAFDSAILVDSLYTGFSLYGSTYEAASSINDVFYSQAGQKMMVIDSSGHFELKNVPEWSFVLGWGKKLYVANPIYRTNPYYQEYKLQ